MYRCIFVGGNKKGDNGFKHISEAVWKLEWIGLGISSITQAKIKSVTGLQAYLRIKLGINDTNSQMYYSYHFSWLWREGRRKQVNGQAARVIGIARLYNCTKQGENN